MLSDSYVRCNKSTILLARTWSDQLVEEPRSIVINPHRHEWWWVMKGKISIVPLFLLCCDWEFRIDHVIGHQFIADCCNERWGRRSWRSKRQADHPENWHCNRMTCHRTEDWLFCIAGFLSNVFDGWINFNRRKTLRLLRLHEDALPVLPEYRIADLWFETSEVIRNRPQTLMQFLNSKIIHEINEKIYRIIWLIITKIVLHKYLSFDNLKH